MSSSAAVYQPTTVTYESNSPPQQQQNQRWTDRPISYLASSVSQAARRPCGISCTEIRTILPIIYLTSSIACFTIGLTLLIHGAIGYANMEDDGFYLSVTIIGALLFVFVFLFVSLYLKATRRLCFRPGKDHLEGSGAQALTVNPSTDLLVAAQYAPVSEVAYQPPNEESEQSKLMPENKEVISNEESDRMVENDPRIVLRPLNQQNLTEET